MKKNILIAGIILLIGFVLSCNSENNNNPNKISIRINTDTMNSEITHDSIYFVLPSPNEIMEFIEDSELSFSSGLTNPASSVSEYTTKTSIELNIGVYLADIAYCAIFQRKNELINYQDALSKLSSNIYLSTNLKFKLNNIRLHNIVSIDSIVNLSEELFYEIVDDLESNQQQKTVAMIYAGAFIESLHLSLNSFAVFDTNNIYFQRLAEQQFAFKNLISYLHQYESDKEIMLLIKQLSAIGTIYNNLNYTQNKISIKQTTDKNIVVSGGKVYKVDVLSFNLLKAKTEAIRQDFISRK